jgi:hypothetical protein
MKGRTGGVRVKKRGAPILPTAALATRFGQPSMIHQKETNEGGRDAAKHMGLPIFS